MREKFTITPEDKKYMASIGKNLRNPPKLVGKAQARVSHLTEKDKANPFVKKYTAKNAALHSKMK